MALLVLAILLLLPVTTVAEPVHDSSALKAQSVRTEPLSISEVLARIELTHPLLRAQGVERIQARAKILKALGAWEPTFKNITQVARIQIWNFLYNPDVGTGGFNDSKLEVGHPWGFRVLGGIRNGFGDLPITGTPGISGLAAGTVAVIPDVKLFYPQQQMIFGGSFPLLRGLMVNDEYADFQKAELAGPQAEIAVAQKRQDLYLAGAVQYWDWQVAVKQAEVQKRTLAVAEERLTQVQGLAKGGKVAPLDVIEVNQEVQTRREAAIAAQRQVEYEQYKLSLFLWENGEPVTPRPEWAPEFQGETPLPTEQEIAAYKVEAKEDRPEVRDLYIEAKMNNIDIKLAKNKLLPKLNFDGGRMDAPADWIVGVGYRYGMQFEMSLFQREARGKVLYAEADQQQLAFKQLYTEQQVSIDVDNWLSAIVRARDRVKAATEALRLAKTLEEGERTRFNMGATTVLFVNIRERNVVASAYELYRAQADYAVARGGMLWAKGALSKPWPESELAKYGNPLSAAGAYGSTKQPGRD
ncbi:TolC family protein [Candidatus Nitrospira nitrificans]|uniref:Putative Outer membrane efflux protein n=1 Tax=Candidatus Nitrospira nitrificans TaxID=1742973 RepID=A0A0S4LL56_9BACT|nr:TolC family protein [Candidatus Nitrospira nitrificans]CUS37328.1 putative Outer membrane efflux protein [Candidatus Nitrospira nitrificans]